MFCNLRFMFESRVNGLERVSQVMSGLLWQEQGDKDRVFGTLVGPLTALVLVLLLSSSAGNRCGFSDETGREMS